LGKKKGKKMILEKTLLRNWGKRLTISLPKLYVDDHMLRAGDVMEVHRMRLNKRDVLVIAPVGKVKES